MMAVHVDATCRRIRRVDLRGGCDAALCYHCCSNLLLLQVDASRLNCCCVVGDDVGVSSGVDRTVAVPDLVRRGRRPAR